MKAAAQAAAFFHAQTLCKPLTLMRFAFNLNQIEGKARLAQPVYVAFWSLSGEPDKFQNALTILLPYGRRINLPVNLWQHTIYRRN
jgi:hypothetical protein